MNFHFSENQRIDISILLITLAAVGILFVTQSHLGFSLLDEGFLWYGAQRVMAGEVQILDFMSYDIGRYYWSGAFMTLLGNEGLIALRAATSVFQGISLFVGLSMLIRGSAIRSRPYLILALLTLLPWMAHQYRLYDTSLPILLAGALAFLIEFPTVRRYFLTGLVVGLIGVFGRNHALYGVVGCLCAMFYLIVSRQAGPGWQKAIFAWLSGIAVGYLPVLIFLLFIPGFAESFWEGIRFLFEIKATNLPLPIPWPWLAPFGEGTFFYTVNKFLEGIFFIAIVLFGILGLFWVAQIKLSDLTVHPLLLSSIFLALPYAHYAYSRADISHLAPGIFPFLLGMLALLVNMPAKIKWVGTILLCSSSLAVMLPAYPGWLCHSTHQCVEMDIGGDAIKVDRKTANNLLSLSKLTTQFSPQGQSILIAPFWPGAYAALGRKSPIWENYVLFPFRSNDFQMAEIKRIKVADPSLVIILDYPLDGRDDLRFSNTRPLIYQYILENFERMHGYVKGTDFQIYRSMRSVQ